MPVSLTIDNRNDNIYCSKFEKLELVIINFSLFIFFIIYNNRFLLLYAFREGEIEIFCSCQILIAPRE